MDEIKPVIGYQKAKTNKFMPDTPAGWAVYDDTTGKRISGTVPYATREEAEAAIPSVVAEIKRRRRAGQEAQAAKAAFRDADDDITVERITRKPVAQQRPYRTVNTFMGPGRIYHDEPGCTYYDDGSGRFAIQMWDN